MNHATPPQEHRPKTKLHAEFLEVENRLWLTSERQQQEEPTAIFQLHNNTLGLNLRAITDIVITCQEEAFGVEWIQEGNINPNMLVMGALSVTATLEAWRSAQDS